MARFPACVLRSAGGPVSYVVAVRLTDVYTRREAEAKAGWRDSLLDLAEAIETGEDELIRTAWSRACDVLVLAGVGAGEGSTIDRYLGWLYEGPRTTQPAALRQWAEASPSPGAP